MLQVPEYLAGSTKDKRTFLEKQAKRKLLWSSKKDQPITEQQKLWANLNVGSEDKTSKFQKVDILIKKYFKSLLTHF